MLLLFYGLADGDGTFTNPLNIVTTYNPGTNDINSGSVNLTLTATNNCGSESNTITKTIVAPLLLTLESISLFLKERRQI
jgi:PKD repeat protein